MPDPTRRLFLRGGASLGALTLLTGCDIIDSDAAEGVLRKISQFNDGVQAWLFNPNKLAPKYPESAITRPFPFNGYYPEDEAPEVDGADLQARGRRPDRQQGAVDAGAALRAAAGVADHPPRLRRGLERDRLMAGRAAVGIPQRLGADTRAKYVWFQCAEGYSNTIDMATALHPQTQLTLQVRQPDPAAQVRLPDEVPHADQARLQEPEVHHGDLRAEQRRRRLLGEPGLQLVQRASSRSGSAPRRRPSARSRRPAAT